MTSSAARTRPHPRVLGPFASALEDDFNTPAALAVMHQWRDHELLRRALGIFGLSLWHRRTKLRRTSSSWRAAVRTRALPVTSTSRIVCARRSTLAARKCGTRPKVSPRPPPVTRSGLRPECRTRVVPRAAPGGNVGHRARGWRSNSVARRRAARQSQAGACPNGGCRHTRPPGDRRLV